MSEKDLEKTNLETIFQETLNQFNYSNNLFDNLESKANSLLVCISIFVGVTINYIVIEEFSNYHIILKSLFISGITFKLYSLWILINLRKMKFKSIHLENLKQKIINNPKNINYKKVLVSKYIPIIDENFENFKYKEHRVKLANFFFKCGAFISLCFITILFNIK